MMRLIGLSILSAAMVFIGATTASAVIFNVSNNYGGGSLSVGDTVTLTVRLDTESQLNLKIVDMGIQFDPAIFEYVDPAVSSPSSMSSYLIYTLGSAGMPPIPATWLTPLPQYVNGGTVDFAGGLDSSPTLFPVDPFDQVNIGFAENSLSGTRDITANTLGQLYADVMGTAVFRVIAEGDGLGDFTPVVNSQNRVQLEDNTILDESVILNGAFVATVPEPGIAAMSLASLATLFGLWARRERSA